MQQGPKQSPNTHGDHVPVGKTRNKRAEIISNRAECHDENDKDHVLVTQARDGGATA